MAEITTVHTTTPNYTSGVTGMTGPSGASGASGVKVPLTAINDFVESVAGQIKPDTTPVYTPDKPSLSAPNKDIADGITPEINDTFNLPYSRAEKTVILNDFQNNLSNQLTSYVQGMQPPPANATALLTQLSQAMASMMSGKTPQLPAAQMTALQNILNTTTAAIANKYGLPAGWSPTSNTAIAWTPVAKTAGVDPSQVPHVVLDQVTATLVKTFEQSALATEALMKVLPQGTPASVSAKSYLNTIDNALQTYKTSLYTMQEVDAEREQKMETVKIDIINAQVANRTASYNSMLAAQAKQKDMGTLGLVMKIVGPILSVACMVVGAALAAVGGIGVPLILIGLVVGAIVTAYSVADSVTNCTQLALQAIDTDIKNDLIADAGADDPTTRSVIEGIITAVVVGTLVLAVIASAIASGGVGLFGAANTVGGLITRIIAEISSQVSMSIMMTILFPAITIYVMPMLQQIGFINWLANVLSTDPNTAQIVTECLVAVAAMVLMIATALVSGKVSSNAAESYSAVAGEATQEALTTERAVLNDLVKQAEELDNDPLANPDKLAALQKQIDVSARRLQSIEKQLELQKQYAPLTKALAKLSQGLDAVNMGWQVGTGIAMGIMHLQMANLLLQKGELDASEQMLQGLMKILTKIIQNIQNDINQTGDFTESISQMQANLFRQASQSLSKIFQG